MWKLSPSLTRHLNQFNTLKLPPCKLSYSQYPPQPKCSPSAGARLVSVCQWDSVAECVYGGGTKEWNNHFSISCMSFVVSLFLVFMTTTTQLTSLWVWLSPTLFLISIFFFFSLYPLRENVAEIGYFFALPLLKKLMCTNIDDPLKYIYTCVI